MNLAILYMAVKIYYFITSQNKKTQSNETVIKVNLIDSIYKINGINCNTTKLLNTNENVVGTMNKLRVRYLIM